MPSPLCEKGRNTTHKAINVLIISGRAGGTADGKGPYRTVNCVRVSRTTDPPERDYRTTRRRTRCADSPEATGGSEMMGTRMVPFGVAVNCRPVSGDGHDFLIVPGDCTCALR